MRESESKIAEDIGYFIIAGFGINVLLLAGVALMKFAMRVVASKRYCLFLTHAKAGAGLFARRTKMLLRRLTNQPIFLDVDELGNLDNIAFVVRSDTENLFVLLTQDTITRFWCVVEIVSAHKNNVPILVGLLGDVSETLTDDFQKRIQWSDDEAAAFTALGISVTEVKEALKALSSSPRFILYPTSSNV